MRAANRLMNTLLLFIGGIVASFVGLMLAGTLGHRIALLIGARRAWFDVDFIDPRAVAVAISVEIGFVSALYLAVGFGAPYRLGRSTWDLLAAANPVACLAGFIVYRLGLPFRPEVAYFGPASWILMSFGFPVFFAATLIGRRLRSGRR